jgi:DNA replication initiation complex subunit (GINS family)
MIDLEALQALRQMEKERDELQPLPTGFADDLTKQIRMLKDAMTSANYREQDLLRDQLKSTVESYLGLMDVRKGKLINQALLQHSRDTSHMLACEAGLFTAMWDGFERHMQDVMKPVDEAYGRRGV